MKIFRNGSIHFEAGEVPIEVVVVEKQKRNEYLRLKAEGYI